MAHNMPRNLAIFSKEEVDLFLNSFDTVICDCDGVLWFLGTGGIPGSPEVVNKFEHVGKKVILVTNNCTLTLEHIHSFCQQLKINVSKEDIVTPAVSMVSYLKENGLENKKAYVIGSESLKSHLESSGIECYKDPRDTWPEVLQTIIEHLKTLDPSVGVVIFDVDINLNYVKCITAIEYLKNTDCHFLAGATDNSIKITADLEIVGPGKFLSLIQTVSGREPIVMGKPGSYIAEVIGKKTPIIPERTLIIGDMLHQDILLGKKCGFQTLLVLSGISKFEDITDDVAPDYYINSLGDLLPLL